MVSHPEDHYINAHKSEQLKSHVEAVDHLSAGSSVSIWCTMRVYVVTLTLSLLCILVGLHCKCRLAMQQSLVHFITGFMLSR